MASRAKTTAAMANAPVTLCHRCWVMQMSQPSKLQRRWNSKNPPSKYERKVMEAKKQWDAQAEEIAAGTRRSAWDILEERGMVKDTAGTREDIRELMRTRRIGAYVGIDPTAASLHLGHLLPLMPLFWMYMHGYRAMTVVGSSTAKIGDPTDRLTSREKIERGRLTTNMAMMHYQLKKLWVNVEEEARRRGFVKEWAWNRGLVHNGLWWGKLTFVEILKRLGEGLRLGALLSRDTVKNRMAKGEGMSYAEFSYPLMQAWDWYHLFKTLGVQMQIGGSDQYGNIVTGLDAVKIIRGSEPNPAEQLPQESVFDDPVGFTVPLLTDSSGAKFGKSAGNALWLDPIQTSPFDLYGYLVRRPDDDVERLLKLFTFVPLAEIDQTMAEHTADASKRVAQHLLAYEVLRLVHGPQVADSTQAQHRTMFGQRQGIAVAADAEAENQPSTTAEDGVSPYQPPPQGVPTTLNNAPRIDMKLPESLILGRSIARILFAAGLATSTSDAQRTVVRKGAYIGGAPGQAAAKNKGMASDQLQFTPIAAWFPEDTRRFLIDGRVLILRKGKHNIRVIEMVSDDEWKRLGTTYPGEPYTGQVRTMVKKLKEARVALAEGREVPNDEAAADEQSQHDEDADVDAEHDSQALEFPERTSRQMQDLRAKYDRVLGRAERTRRRVPVSASEWRKMRTSTARALRGRSRPPSYAGGWDRGGDYSLREQLARDVER